MHSPLARLLALPLEQPLLILTHDNPDPDAVASAFALQHLLAERRGIHAEVAYSGIIGRAENRMMVDLLELQMRRLGDLRLDSFRTIALIDAQPGTGNSALPEGKLPDIVLDHHPLRPLTESVPFHDVRAEIGASATLLTSYLQEAGVAIPSRIATGLLYGIKTETQDLAREVSALDREAYEYLLPLADAEKLAKIARPPLSQEYFRNLLRALEGLQIGRQAAICAAGDVLDPDFVPEMADMAARIEGVRWALAYGKHQEFLYLSVRTNDTSVNAGELIQQIVRGLGTGGGHGMRAGAKVQLSSENRSEVEAAIRRRFIEVADPSAVEFRSLMPEAEVR